MRYDACRCVTLSGARAKTESKVEEWKPFPDQPTTLEIERCVKCSKIKYIRGLWRGSHDRP